MATNEKPNLRALIVEDSQEDVLLIVGWLRGEWKVVWKRVENEAGLLLALDDNWDVIICDVRLPHFSAEKALEVTLEYLARKNTTVIPFIVVSGVVDEEEVIKLLRRGARDFIDKDHMQRLTFVIDRELRHTGELLAFKLKIEDVYDSVIEAWGKALELRDRYTVGHTERVTMLSLRLALELHIPHADFIDLTRGAFLHDIGKMGIPDQILFKQDALLLEEMEIMKKHAEYGYNMVKDIPFLKNAAVIPYCHHERWNGTGYPQGLFGSENVFGPDNPTGTGIPFLARMFAVVDVYDALTSDRPYRKSWEKARVIAYIMEERNITLDGTVVDAFVEMIGRG